MGRDNSCFWPAIFAHSENQVIAYSQSVDSDKFFPSTARNSAYTVAGIAGNYLNGEFEVLNCSETSPKCFSIKSANFIFLKERRSCVAWDDLRKLKGK